MPSLHSDVKFIGIVNLKIFLQKKQTCIIYPMNFPSSYMKLVFIGIVNEKIFGVGNQPCIKKPETAIGLSHGWDAPCPRRETIVE